jgi:glycosyltransferase involved in cell wall biosynthesis
MTKKTSLCLFFTRAVTLKKWVESGLLSRENVFYEQFINSHFFEKIYWVTYGHNDDYFAKTLYKNNMLNSNIHILSKPRIYNFLPLGCFLYSFFAPLHHRKSIKKCRYIKSNQIDGGWTALIASLLFKKLLIIRCGYGASSHFRGKAFFKYSFFKITEYFLYKYSNSVIVTSKHESDYIKESFPGINPLIVSNYVDTRLFHPRNIKKSKCNFLFVGRLSKDKNLFSLIKAFSNKSLSLDIYGSGELKEDLYKSSFECNSQVNFKGSVANNMLPKIYNKYKYFILTSYREGMPKALLEAMSSGCVCIGTNVVGINEVIVNGENGFLIDGNDTVSISKFLDSRIFDKDSKTITRNARKNIISNYSLEQVVKKEKKIYMKLLRNEN